MKVIISNSSPDPIYEQISRQVKAQIISGDLTEGQVLPSIRRLADELEKEGFINTVGGKGTFVAVQNPELLREKKMKIVEEKLAQAVDEAKLMGIGEDQIIHMLQLLFQEDE
jgi:GntR family transcriptional regulator